MFDIEQPENILTSDHIPIMCSLNLPTRKAEPVHKRDTVAWNKCTQNDKKISIKRNQKQKNPKNTKIYVF